MKQIMLTIFLIAAFSFSAVQCHPSICTKPNTTEIVYRGDGDELDEIYNALITCPNITTLDLDLVWSGCIAPSEPWAFQFQPDHRFPTLRKLSLSDYDLEDQWRQSPFFQTKWSIKNQIVYALKHIPQYLMNVYNGEFDQPVWVEMPPPKESNLEKRLRAMDFSQIEELRLAQEERVFYERMGSELPTLKRLYLEFTNSGIKLPDERVKFIKSVAPLQALSLDIGAPYYYSKGPKNRTQFPLDEILGRHGQTLQNLVLKQREGWEPNLRRPMLSIEQINAIEQSCPHLQHLGLDIDRDASYGWPVKTFDALARITSLESLTMRLEIGADLHSTNEDGEFGWNPEGLDGPGPLREPRMSLDVAEALLNDLRRMKEGRELTKVEFVVGNFEDKPYSGPIYSPSWDEGRARMFTCESNPEGIPDCSIQGERNSYGFALGDEWELELLSKDMHIK